MTKSNNLDELIAKGLVVKGSDASLDMVRVTSGIPQLDAILGGGYAYGKNVLCVGPESTGKTIIAQYAVAVQQGLGKRALLIDAEMSFDREWWALTGVNTDELLVSRPPTAEAAIDTIVAMLADKDLGIIVLDSLATLSPAVIQEKGSGQRTVASLASLITAMYQKLMPVNKHTIFFAINQLRDNMDGYEDSYPGGRAQRHNSHIILRTRREGWIVEKEQRIGYTMEILAKKNKVGAPMGVVSIPFRFNSQIDMISSYVNEAVERGFIRNAGPYYYWGEIRWLGKGNVVQHFSENEGDLAALKASLGNN